MNLRTAFLWVLIGSLSLAALLGIMAIIAPGLFGAEEEILITAVLLGLHSMPALACSIVLGKRRIQWAMWLGVSCSPVAWVCWLPLIWGNPWSWSSGHDWEVVLLKGGFTLTFISLWAAHFGMMLVLRLDRPWFRHARTGTLAVAGIILALSVPALWAEWDEELFFRLLAVLGILGGCGTVVTPIFALLDTIRRRTTRESIAGDTRVQLICPRCGSEQTLRVGPSRCEACGLHVEMNIEEPRCKCGYLLFKLTGDCCPECGRTVRCECGCLVDNPAGRCPKCGKQIQQATGV